MPAKKRPAAPQPPEILGDPEVLHETVALPGRAAPEIQSAERHAAERRAEAFSAVPHWAGKKLHPLSVSRETLFLELRAAMGAPNIYRVMQDGEAWWPDAVRLLWICSHLPEAWEDLRPEPARLQGVIDAWADETLRGEDKVPASLVTLRLWNQAQENIAEPAPVPGGKAADLGN
jgi:hypothetical protein